MPRSSALRRLAIGSASGLLLAAAFLQPITAAPRVRDFAAIDDAVSRLQAKGASQATIDKVFADNGLVRVSTSGPGSKVAASASTSNDITLGQPSVYEDTRFSYFVATASFQWKHNCNDPVRYKNQCVAKECLIVYGDCGGPDGFGVRLNRAVNEIKTSFYTHNTDGYQMPTWTNPTELNEYGASWVEQDRLDNGRYNWDGGNVYYMFDLAGCTHSVPFKVYSRLDHTWSNTDVTGFGISSTGFSVSWNTTSAHWTATNPVTTYWTPC